MHKPAGVQIIGALGEGIKDLVIFSKLERIVAAICMGIPFFLILADTQADSNFWSLVFGTLIIVFVPLIVSGAAFQIKKMEGSGIPAFAGSFIFVVLLFYFWYSTLPADFIVRESISDYVSMDDAHIFGLLLATASMLFVFNGAVYINKVAEGSKKKHGKWYNIALGIFLMGVVLFPCTNEQLADLHFFCAGMFFGGSAVVIAVFNNKEHRKISLFIAALTIIGFAIYFLEISGLDWFTLFWAETLSLWVIGIHYILESLGELS